MIVDSKYVEELRRNRIDIPQELEDILLDRLGDEPESYSYSEQDLYEQARKIVQRYSTPKGRLELLYGADIWENKLEKELLDSD